MKFSSAAANSDGLIPFEGDEFFECNPPDLQPCVICREKTNWVSTLFMVYVCSEECARKNDKDYWAAGGACRVVGRGRRAAAQHRKQSAAG
jgi:hypothetical protein